MCTHPWVGSRFQSTLPLRGATLGRSISLTRFSISIHAPLTGSDVIVGGLKDLAPDFNPRSPYGERHIIYINAMFIVIFQSTLPLRGATGYDWQAGTTRKISIHAPLTGSDLLRQVRAVQ